MHSHGDWTSGRHPLTTCRLRHAIIKLDIWDTVIMVNNWLVQTERSNRERPRDTGDTSRHAKTDDGNSRGSINVKVRVDTSACLNGEIQIQVQQLLSFRCSEQKGIFWSLTKVSS